MSAPKVLVVDDEPKICDVLQEAMNTAGFEVVTSCRGEDATRLAEKGTFDFVFLDIKMPGINGVELLKKLRRVQRNATFVMITGYAGSELVDESLSSGAIVCLSKPFSIAQVIDLVRSLAEEREARHSAAVTE